MSYWIEVSLSVLGGYVSLSLLFFYFPELIHKKKKPNGISTTVNHISHRGGAAERPENTMSAYEHAVSVGSQMLELDVRLTKDKQVVVHHDENLLRLTGVNANLRSLNYAELPTRFLDTIAVTFSPDNQMKTTDFDTHIPLLEEVFRTFPEIPINIDLKDSDEVLIDKVYELIKRYKRENLVVWGSFVDSTVNKVHQKYPEILTFCSFKSVLKIIFMYYTGLLPFFPVREGFFEIPMFAKRELPNWKFAVPMWIVRNVLGSSRLFWHLRKRGIAVFTWVQNSEEDYNLCWQKLKVGGMMTDYPTKLTEYYSKVTTDKSSLLKSK